MAKVYISNNPEMLRNFLKDFDNTATVEAEYGDELVSGTILTLAHHGKNKANPPPCVYEKSHPEVEVIGVSHLDLDSIGGILAILGTKPFAPSFWNLAGWVDINGPHKLNTADFVSSEDLARLYAWWAWVKNNKVYPQRDGTVDDVSAHVENARNVLVKIIGGDSELLESGKLFIKHERKLNEDSYLSTVGDIIVRSSVEFVNHLYSTPLGKAYLGVAALKEDSGEITISLADELNNFSCVEFIQSIYGDKAGGHKQVAGGPRSGGYTKEDLMVVSEKFARAVINALLTKNVKP